VMTGCRVARGGMQARAGVAPDMTCLGKIVGGGMPLAAYGGRRAIMEKVAPLGPVYQAGTLSGNPVAMAAGLATLDLISAPGFHAHLEETTEILVQRLTDAALSSGIPLAANHVCGMFGLFFTPERKVDSFAKVMACDTERFSRFFHRMLEECVYFAPSAFEAGFVSAAHSSADIDATIAAATRTFDSLTSA